MPRKRNKNNPNNLDEEWRETEDYGGRYYVSNLGNVKSINWHNEGYERLMLPQPDKRGYLRLILCRDKKGHPNKVHRLVAKAFIPNPENLPQVNHINEDKTDNRVSNLEWADNIRNCNHGTRNKRLSKSHKGISTGIKPCKIVEDNVVFKSQVEAAKYLGVNKSSVSDAYLGKSKTCKGKHIVPYKEYKNDLK